MRLRNTSLQELIAGAFGRTGPKLYAITGNHRQSHQLGSAGIHRDNNPVQKAVATALDILDMQGQVTMCYAETCLQKFISDNLLHLRELAETDLIREFTQHKLNLRQGFVSTGMGDLQGKLFTVAEAKKRKANIYIQSGKQQKQAQQLRTVK